MCNNLNALLLLCKTHTMYILRKINWKFQGFDDAKKVHESEWMRDWFLISLKFQIAPISILTSNPSKLARNWLKPKPLKIESFSRFLNCYSQQTLICKYEFNLQDSPNFSFLSFFKTFLTQRSRKFLCTLLLFCLICIKANPFELFSRISFAY